MNTIDTLCPCCGAFLRPMDHKWYACSCGLRKYMKEFIKLSDLLTSSGKYPDRLQSPELTKEVKENATKLLNKVNQLLEELKVEKVVVSSGFRTSASNASIPNAAKKSNHMKGLAIDLADADGVLDELFLKHLDILKKYELYLESPDSTKGWSHLQCIAPGSGNRVFKP